MTKQPNLQLAQQLLADWWLNHSEITPSQLRDELKLEYPDHIWSQQWVNYFLFLVDHNSTEINGYKVYSRNTSVIIPVPDVKVPVRSFSFILAASILIDQEITKEKLKSVMRTHTSINDFLNFEEEFEKSNFCHTGKYTKDRKKIYVWLQDNEYWSISKQEVILIEDMPKPYIKNSLAKKYPHVTIDFLLNNRNHEVTKLINQYYK